MAVSVKEKVQIAEQRYHEKITAEVEKINGRIDEIKARSQYKKADMDLDYDERMEELEAKKKAVDIKLQELQAVSEDAWDDLERGLEKAWDELTEAFERASSRF